MPIALALCAAAALAAPTTAPANANVSANVARGTIEVEPRIEPFLDLWFLVRARAADGAAPPEMLRAAVEATSYLHSDLQSPLAWVPVEARIAHAKSVAEARAIFEQLPDAYTPATGGSIELKRRALAIVDALAPVEASFLETVWPAREAKIKEARALLDDTLFKRQSEVFEHHAKRIGCEDLDLTVPCVLVGEMPEPGAVTHRAQGGAVSFVGVEGLKSSDLCEVVLHEATHAIDVAVQGDVFDDLRAALEKAGIKRTDKRWRDAPHTLMFAASGATVRLQLDPEHTDYGETSRYYSKVGPVAEPVRAAWKAFDAGEIDRAEAVARIVKDLAPATK